MPAVRRIPIILLTLLCGLLLWTSLNLMYARAGGTTVADDTYTVSGDTYGVPPDLMAPFSLLGDEDIFITFLFDGFTSSDADRLQLNSEAKITSGVLRVAPAQSQKNGSAFNKERVSLKDDRSFSTYFVFRLNNGSGWADGFVFTVQTDSNKKAGIGGSLGYAGISPSVGIEFDTYRNTESWHDDPSDHHIALVKNGDIEFPIKKQHIDPSDVNMKDGTPTHVWIDYDGPNGVIEVRMSKTESRPEDPVLSHTFGSNEKLTDILNSDRVYVGFTAATGGSYQNHDIEKWYFTNEFDPIDTENNDYQQVPITAYNITPVPLDDGTVELTITPVDGDDHKNVPLTIEGTNGAVLVPAATDTGEDGYAVVNARSPDGDTLETTITVTGPGGITSSLDVTIPGRTAAPDEDDILANATDGTVAVTGVPAGATVKVYDHLGNLLDSESGVMTGEVLFTGLSGLTVTQPIDVTFTVSPQVESEKTSVFPMVRSVLDPSDVQVNATTDEAMIRDVPKDGVIRVYDAPGGTLVGTGANEDNAAADIVVQIDGLDVEHMQKVYVTLQADGELESEPVEVEALAESSKLDKDQIEADGTADRVTVRDVPAYATVVIYDEDGDELGRGENDSAAVDDVVVEDLDLEVGMSISVTLIEPDKLESDPVTVPVVFEKSAAPVEIDANATKSIVTVKDVPAKTTVTVYDDDNHALNSASNPDDAAADVSVTIASPRLAKDQVVHVTLSEPRKTESDKVQATAYYERSAKPDEDRIETDGNEGRITVRDVPGGATVVIYGEDGGELARGENDSAAVVDVVVEDLDLDVGMSISVTLIEEYKLESDPVTVPVVFEKSAAPVEIDANATKSIVTVKDVPAKATVTVYGEDGGELNSAPNPDDAAADVRVTIASPRLAKDQVLHVTLTEPKKTESAKVQVTAYYEKSAQPDAHRIIVNATDNMVTIAGVKPGATITVYDAAGNVVLGTEQNALAEDADLTIAAAAPLTAGEPVLVTNTEPYHDESDPVSVTALEKTAPLPEERIRADATDSRITFKDIPDGAEIVVYNDLGDPIAVVANDQGRASDLAAEISAPGLVHEQEIRVTIREKNKLVSDPTTTKARERSAMPQLPDVLDIDVDAGTVKMGNVPSSAEVIIYDPDGREIGRETESGSTGEAVVTGLALESSFQVTYTEPGKFESEKLSVDIDNRTQEQIDDAVSELEIGYQEGDTWESVTLPLFVVSVGKHNTSVSWTSSKPDVIVITDPKDDIIVAHVHRQAQDESVILTAEVSKNGKVKTRTFLVIVKAVGLDKSVEKQYRQVKVTGGVNDEVDEHVDIDRVLLSDGTKQAKIDKAIFDEATASKFVGDARTRNTVTRIYVDEVPGDEADEFAVEVPEASMRLLAANGNSIEVRTDYGGIMIELATLEDMVDNYLDLYFRLVPVKDPELQREINSRIRREEFVKAEAGGKAVDILGASVKVETNYSGYPTVLTLYFEKNGIRVPAGDVTKFLDSLRVYIEHSDGTKAVVVPNPVYEGGDLAGISIAVDKFSTFSVLRLVDRPVGTYTPDTAEESEPGSGLEQIVSAEIDPVRQEIVLELDGEDYGIDPDGFEVTAEDGTAVSVEVIAEGGRVTIRLKDPLPPGTRVAVNYSPKPEYTGTDPHLRPFSGLVLTNPGYHAAYIRGYDDGTFRPEHPVSRAEIAAILARNMVLPDNAAYQGLYPDVPFDHWAWSDIERLRGAGLLIGDTDGRFRPQDVITRAEMATIASRWLQLELRDNPSLPFSDADGHWAASAIDAAYRAGIVRGYADGTFGPDRKLTRAEVVVIMNRMLGRGPIRWTGRPTWPDVDAGHWALGDIEDASRDHHYLYDDEGNETMVESP